MPFVMLNDLTPTRIEWLWPGRLPLGYLTMIDGDPATGKSFLAIDLCARITTGQSFPDGQPGGNPAAVVVLGSEDGVSDILHSRMRAAGADKSRVAAFKREDGEAPIRFPGHARRLEEVIAHTRARYVVIDPITSYLEKNVNVASDHSVRAALDPLADVAARQHCTIHLVRHLNKDGGGNPLYRGLHSIGFTAMCRVAWLVGQDPHASNQFVLAQPKNNLDAAQPSLSFTIEPGENGPRVVWHGETGCAMDALLAGPSVRMRQRFRTQDFLRTILRNGPRNNREIKEAAAKHHISESTLERAANDLKIRFTRRHIGKPEQTTYWVMPDQAFTSEISDTPNLDDWIRRWDE